MLYNVVRKMQGKTTVMLTDTLPKAKARMKLLQNGHRGCGNITFTLAPADTNEKFKKKSVKRGY